MAALLERLAGPTLVENGATTTLYTATSKTLVRTIDIGISVAESGDNAYMSLNGTATSNAFYYFSLASIAAFQWRGGMVLNTGDTIGTAVTAVTAADYTVTICGVTGLPSS